MQFTGKFGSNKKKMLERKSFTKTFFCDEFGNKVYLTYSLKGVKEKKVVHP